MCMCVQEGAEPELRVGGPSLTQGLDLVSEPTTTSLKSPTHFPFVGWGLEMRHVRNMYMACTNTVLCIVFVVVITPVHCGLCA